ncbi:Lrp/AsnC family transcriptional regulator [Streptomyces sp. NBC_00876]|uniref:Lrp/AsnC family transcriptional regulator n=1 Tax=Streptomyces sp. NBC_00876 TaxID=2975853 RepID=UPI0038651E42|nr:Lrp/AsnC family transcriptional regulator [Streptomyces sp. NBC_00876]
MPADNYVLSEADRSVIHALQIAPRAAWSRLAAVLGGRPDTLAQRWARMCADGTAWCGALGLHTGETPPCMAWVEVFCTGERDPLRTALLTEDPHVLSVFEVTGDRSMLLYVAFPDLTMLDEHLSTRLLRLPGVTGTRTHLVTSVHRSGTRWRLDRLDRVQTERLIDLPGRGHVPGGAAVPSLRPEDRRLVLAMAGDSRLGVAELARLQGRSESATRRQLHRLENSGTLTHNCRPVPLHSGWPVSVVLWADFPAPDPATPPPVVHLRETVDFMSVTGPHNLAITVMLRTLEDLPGCTAALMRRMPGLRIADTVVVLRCHKTAAQVLGPDGRRIRTVPPDIWTRPVPLPTGL